MNLTTEKCPFCDAWTKTTPWIHLLGELLFEINSSVWLFSKLLLFIINLSKMDWSNTVRGWLYFRTKTCTTSHEATWLHIYSLKLDDLLKLLWHLGSMDTSLSPYIYHEYVSSIVIRWKHTGRFWEVCFNFFFQIRTRLPTGWTEDGYVVDYAVDRVGYECKCSKKKKDCLKNLVLFLRITLRVKLSN